MGDGTGSEVASVIGPPPSEAASRRSRGSRLPAFVPDEINGMPVSFVQGRLSMTHTYHDRLSVRCSNPAHTCTKSRSLGLLRDKFGDRCAEAFLGAWLAVANTMDQGAHAKYTPNVAEMTAYLAAHP